MKKAILFLFLLVISKLTIAQDIIYLNDDREIKAKVIEVTDQAIKYKKFDNQEGPSYSANITEVKKIKYANGSEDVFAGKETKSGSSEPASGSGKFDIEDEETHDYIEAIAQNGGIKLLERCVGKADNTSVEIYWDQVYKDMITGEIQIPIIVKWSKGPEGRERWVRGSIKVDKSGKKMWSYQADSGIMFAGCAKGMLEL